MDLNQLQIYPRVRNHWSAIDMGVRLARSWYKDLFWGWFLGASVVLFVLSICFFWAPWVIFLGFWWVKPLLDRLPLYIGSRKLFGQNLTLRAALLEGWPHLRRDFFALLTWRRFSPSRSFDQPVTVLENLRGNRRQRRLQQLHNAGFTQSCWLTWVCACLEGAGYFACYALILMMIPETYQVSFQDLMEGEGLLSHVLNTAITLLIASAVAPFYVMGGFLLYLNRRIALEGWDIELQFRALAQRLALRAERYGDATAGPNVATGSSGSAGPSGKGSGMVAMLPLFLCLSITIFSGMGASPALAVHRSDDGLVTEKMREFVREIEPRHSGERAEVRKSLEAVLTGAEFHSKRQVGRWQRRGIDDTPPVVHSEFMIRLVEWLENLEFFGTDKDGEKSTTDLDDLLTFANILEISLWCLLILVVGVVVYRYRNVLLEVLSKLSNRPLPERRPPPATEIQGLDIRPETLPEDVPTQVRNLCEAGDPRQGLALLYRASLSRLAHRWQVPFAGHHTENECLALVESQAQSGTSGSAQQLRLTSVFSGVVQLWVHCAYGHQAPDLVVLEKTLTQWPEVFDGK